MKRLQDVVEVARRREVRLPCGVGLAQRLRRAGIAGEVENLIGAATADHGGRHDGIAQVARDEVHALSEVAGLVGPVRISAQPHDLDVATAAQRLGEVAARESGRSGDEHSLWHRPGPRVTRVRS